MQHGRYLSGMAQSSDTIGQRAERLTLEGVAHRELQAQEDLEVFDLVFDLLPFPLNVMLKECIIGPQASGEKPVSPRFAMQHCLLRRA